MKNQQNQSFMQNVNQQNEQSSFQNNISQTIQHPQIQFKSDFQSVNSLNDIEIGKLTAQQYLILKNNFYLRLEIVSRGRYIYEPQLLEKSLLSSQSSILESNSHIQSNFKISQNVSFRQKYHSLFNIQNQFLLHQAIFNCDLRQVSKLLKLEVPGIFYCEKNQLDPCGNTPLMLAVKLGNLDAVKILSDMYTCPKLRPLQELMNAKEIAIALKNQQILKIIISSNQKIKQQFFEQNKNSIFEVLEEIPNFKVDLNFTCESNWFPIFSSVAPSDTYKIYKQGSNLRLDMTLLGLQKFNLIKGNISVLYKGRGSENEGELLIVDNKMQTVQNVFNRNQENKINSQIQEILSGKQILKKYQTHSVTSEIEINKQGAQIKKKVNEYECEKCTLKSRYTMIKYQMNLQQIDKINNIKSFEEYVDILKVDYLYFIEMHLDQISYERENNQLENGANNNSSFFKRNLAQNGDQKAAPLTSRIKFGGTTKLENGGGFSSRDNDNQFRNLGDFNNNNALYTQEDHVPNDRYCNQFDQKQSANEDILQQENHGNLQANKQITIKKKQQKQIQANIWLSKQYPFNIDQFLPLIHLLSFCSKQIRQFNKFLLKYPLPQSDQCFPIEARIPLFMTMEAVFSFKNIDLNFNDPLIFEIDKEVMSKQMQNMALYAKQQISFLNMHSSLETLEDKQAKALKEIYKLCKTDEGDQSAEYFQNNDDDDFQNQNSQLLKIKQNKNKSKKDKKKQQGYESENSEKIKELFNQMITKEEEQYDIRNDPLLIMENENNSDAEQENLLGIQNQFQNEEKNTQKNFHSNNNFKSQNQINEEQKISVSRNFATGENNFNGLKNSFTLSEVQRNRNALKNKEDLNMKTGLKHRRSPQKQYSMQSDITESVEVSERSFNDKLAKLQIHSFNNVKFMSQFKKNMAFGDYKNIGSQAQLKGIEYYNLNDQNLILDINENKTIKVIGNEQFKYKQEIQQVVNLRSQHLSKLEQFKESSESNKATKQKQSQGSSQINSQLNNKTSSCEISKSIVSQSVGKNKLNPSTQKQTNPNIGQQSTLNKNYEEELMILQSKPTNDFIHHGPQVGKIVQKSHNKKVSNLSHNSMLSSINYGENIYDSKLNEERPKVNKSLGKHQFNNNLQSLRNIKNQNGQFQSQFANFEMIQNQNAFQKIIQEMNQSNVTIGSISTVYRDFKANLPIDNLIGINQRNIPRQKNQINFINPLNNQNINSGMSLGVSQIDSSDVGSIASGFMNSMSSVIVGGGNLQSYHGYISFMNNDNNNQASNSSLIRNMVGQQNNFKSYDKINLSNQQIGAQTVKGHNSTIDSSNQNNAISQSSNFSISQSKKPNIFDASGSQQSSILDSKKRKVFISNLRNDRSNLKYGLQRPGGYLNTIESEGNLPTQHFNTNKDEVEGHNFNDISRHSIHSLESLHSEENNYQSNIQNQNMRSQILEKNNKESHQQNLIPSVNNQIINKKRKVNEEEQKRGTTNKIIGTPSGLERSNQMIMNNTSHFSSKYRTLTTNNHDGYQIEQEERNLHVPMHTQENASLNTQENKLHDFYQGAFEIQSAVRDGDDDSNQQQIFSYEKLHKMRGLENFDNMLVQIDQKGQVNQNGVSRNSALRMKNKQDSVSQQPPNTDGKLQLKLGNMAVTGNTSSAIVDMPQMNANQFQSNRHMNMNFDFKQNFLQKLGNFIQESITERKQNVQNTNDKVQIRQNNIQNNLQKAQQQSHSMNNLFHNKNENHNNIQNEYQMIQNIKQKDKQELQTQKMEKYEQMSNEDQLFLRKLSNSKGKSEEKYQKSSQKIEKFKSKNFHLQSKNSAASSFQQQHKGAPQIVINYNRISESQVQNLKNSLVDNKGVKDSMDSKEQMSGGSYEANIKVSQLMQIQSNKNMHLHNNIPVSTPHKDTRNTLHQNDQIQQSIIYKYTGVQQTEEEGHIQSKINNMKSVLKPMTEHKQINKQEIAHNSNTTKKAFNLNINLKPAKTQENMLIQMPAKDQNFGPGENKQFH